MSSSDESKASTTRKNGKSEPEEVVASVRSSPRKRRSELKESSSSSETSTPLTSPLTSPKISKETSEMISPTSYSSPKSKVDEPTPSTSRAPDPYCTPGTPDAGQEESQEETVINPKVMHYFLNSYKDSPDYQDLKNKRFNTSFLHETPRGDRDIQIFTPEEDASPFYTENLPVIKNKIRGVPGEKYAAAFKSIPGLSSGDSEEEVKSKKKAKGKNVCKGEKKGRKQSVGYKGVPLPDDKLLVDYTGFFDSDSTSHHSSDVNEEKSGVSSSKKTSTKSNVGASSSKKISTKRNVGGASSKKLSKKANASILLSLLSAPSNKKAFKSYKSRCIAAASSKKTESQMKKYQKIGISQDSALKKDQMYLDRYKHLIGDRYVRIVVKRLPSDTLQSYITKKKPKFAVTSKGKKRAGKCALLPYEKAIDNQVLRVRLSRLSADKHYN